MPQLNTYMIRFLDLVIEYGSYNFNEIVIISSCEQL